MSVKRKKKILLFDLFIHTFIYIYSQYLVSVPLNPECWVLVRNAP